MTVPKPVGCGVRGTEVYSQGLILYVTGKRNWTLQISGEGKGDLETNLEV